MDEQSRSTEEQKPTAVNKTLFQAFEWHVPADHNHWSRLTRVLPALKSIGIDNIWLPPGCKASNPWGNGYDIYDLYDLGEFDQKGRTTTKWGSKEELLKLTQAATEVGVEIYWDAVLNHKAGADHEEQCEVVEVDANDRTKLISKPYETNVWLGFDFPGRGDTNSSLKYHWYHFSGTDFDARARRNGIFKILGQWKDWASDVDKERGNYDYLMFADIDFSHPEVVEDVKKWGKWIVGELGLHGFRLDAAKHYSRDFIVEWTDHIRKECGDHLFFVGEYWSHDIRKLLIWLAKTHYKISLFDVPLMINFSWLSWEKDSDLREIFYRTIVGLRPANAVTFVTNHDTQPGQSLETPVQECFKPLAYALILLRAEGYPCVFYGDLYGLNGPRHTFPSCGGKLPALILARKLFAYGAQDDYFDTAHCIGWVRRGTWDRPYGCAVLMSNLGPGNKRMQVGEIHAGEIWTDLLGWQKDTVEIDSTGWGQFTCSSMSVSVWVKRDAEGREQFPIRFDVDIYERGRSWWHQLGRRIF